MSKIGVIGDRDSVLAFGALGVTAFPADGPEEAGDLLRKAAREGYVCLFLTEALARDMGEVLEEYRRRPGLAILLIPSHSGSLGIGVSFLKEAVEKAVGQDILFQKRG